MNKLSLFAVVLLAIAAVMGASAIALAALAGHGLPHMVADGARAVGLFNTAWDFQMKQTLALVLMVLVGERLDGGRARCAVQAAAVLTALGGLLFPTALYSSAFGGPVWWAPWGGTTAMLGWLALGIGAILARRTA